MITHIFRASEYDFMTTDHESGKPIETPGPEWILLETRVWAATGYGSFVKKGVIATWAREKSVEGAGPPSKYEEIL